MRKITAQSVSDLFGQNLADRLCQVMRLSKLQRQKLSRIALFYDYGFGLVFRQLYFQLHDRLLRIRGVTLLSVVDRADRLG